MAVSSLTMRGVIGAIRRSLWLRRLRQDLKTTAEEQMAENLRTLSSEGPDVLTAKIRERYLPEWERDLAERERWLLSEKEPGGMGPDAVEMELKRLRDYRSRRRATDRRESGR